MWNLQLLIKYMHHHWTFNYYDSLTSLVFAICWSFVEKLIFSKKIEENFVFQSSFQNFKANSNFHNILFNFKQFIVFPTSKSYPNY